VAVGVSSSWLAGGLSEFLARVTEWLDLLIIPFFVYYILVGAHVWRASAEDLIPPRFRPPLSRLFDEVGRILQSYVRGQLLIALAMAGLYAAGFLALGVPAWAGLAAISGLLNVVPYVGTLLGMVLASAFKFSESTNWLHVAGVVGVFSAVQAIEGYYLTPRILGGRLNLHPMAVFLGLLIGGKLFGLLGILLAIPVVAVSKVFLLFARELYKGSWFYHDGEDSTMALPEDPAEKLAHVADVVLAQQEEAGTGDELLAPKDKPDKQPAAAAPVLTSDY
jgi:predicted PurR-regulated permease PerM